MAYADLQATLGHERSFTEPSKPLQLWRVERFFDELKRIYDEFQCQALWDLGDTTDDRTAIPVPAIDLLCDRLEYFNGQWNIKLVGNHEQYLRDTTVNSGKAFRKHFQVVETVDTFDCGKFTLLCASYHDDFAKLLDFFRNAPKHGTVLLGHFPVVGCQMSNGKSLTGIPRNVIDFVDVGLLGHVHVAQQIGSKLHYIGSPFQQHWGEAGEQKRVAILDLGTNDGTYKLSWQWINGMPIYRQVDFEQWKGMVKPDSEDRFKVVLKSLAETEAFYAHPLASRVDEAVYDYTPTADPGEAGQVSNSKEDLMARYVKENPPIARNIDLDTDSMLKLGDQISSPQ